MRPASLICLLLMSAFTAAGQSARISSIDISGNKITDSRLVLRELPVRAGQHIRADSLAYYLDVSRLRLLNLGLFTTVDVRPVHEHDTALQITIDVRERWYIIPKPIFQLADRNFNVWWDEMHRDLRRINAGMTVTDNNFRGNMELLSATVQVGYTQCLALEYVRPYMDGSLRHGLGFGLGVTQSGELPYATDSNKLRFARLPGSHIIRQYDGRLSWYYRPGYAFRHSLTLGYHHADISDTLRRLNGEYFGNSSSRLRYADLIYRLDYNGVDNWNYPLRGLKSVSQLVFRKGIDGLRAQGQIRTETGIFTQLRERLYALVIFRGRLSFPDDVPYFLQGALGTRTDYVRGYEYYVVDGTHYGLLRFDLKYALLNRTFRSLRFRYLPELPLRIYPKLFADAGIVRNPYPGNSFLHDRMLYSAGLGVDMVSAYDFKLRIEAGVNHLGQYGVYLHLNSE
jgi:outer membrane protein assembly factor BamA